MIYEYHKFKLYKSLWVGLIIATIPSGCKSSKLGAGGGGGLSLTGFTAITFQSFTASGTYMPTTGMQYCIIEALGGGGGGGGVTGTNAAQIAVGQSGGAAGYAKVLFSAAQIAAISGTGLGPPITIGAGGTGGFGTNSGFTGGTTTVGLTGTPATHPVISANGGVGGSQGNPSATNVVQVPFAGSTATVVAGTYTGTPIIIQGGFTNYGFGSFPATGAQYIYVPLGGGSTLYGYGGEGITVSGNSGNGIPGTGYGSGGSAAAAGINASGATGGNGQPGIVLITEYIL